MIKFKSAVGKAALFALTLGFFIASSPGAFSQPSEMTVLFSDDFGDGIADGWELEAGWGVELEDDNYVLSGKGHKWAGYSERWGDYSFKTKVKLIDGAVHLNYRMSDCERYFIGFHENGLYLSKTKPCDTHTELKSVSANHRRNRWYTVEVVGTKGNILVYVDGILRINYTDADPLLYGSIAFEGLDDSHVQFDDVMIIGETPLVPPPGFTWKNLGGPLGGIGYDVRVDPEDSDILYVSDAWAGVSKSYDGGESWASKNKGIITRTGPSNDAVPVFCLTIDPNDNNILWVGMQGFKGVYKSTDAGETWGKMDNGVEDAPGVTFRQFTIEPGNSDVVYLSGERPVPEGEFSQSTGFIYKTTDGGENWELILETKAIMRHIIIDPTDHDIIYAAAGIFDRNDIEPEGIFKSIDGGKTWRHINNGLEEGSLTVGGLAMDPQNPKILYATTGRHGGFVGSDPPKEARGGIYKSTDGGERWEKVYGGPFWDTVGYLDHLSINYITVDPTNLNNVYAATGQDFFISRDAGKTWKTSKWNPPGVVGGIPISIAVDSENPDIIYINSYIGGIFKSTDAGETWTVSSRGYSGAQILGISTYPDNPAIVYANGRQGVAKSHNGGEDWIYINQQLPEFGEGLAIEVDPSNHDVVLASNRFEGGVYKTTDGGRTWKKVFHSGSHHYPESLHGIKTFKFAPSNSDIIYAGHITATETQEVDPKTQSYGMVKSIDGGDNWEFINSDLEGTTKNINDIAVHPVNPDVVYIATPHSGVFKSTDGGESWVGRNNGLTKLDVRSIAIDPDNPDTIYAGMENGGVFKSTDDGASWKPIIKGMDFEASIRSIVVNPSNSQIVYAADLRSGIYRSDDSGSQWVKINEGLETRAVNDMAISKEGSILYAGTEGGGVFRLGEPPVLEPEMLPSSVSTETATPITTPPLATLLPKPEAEKGICGPIAILLISLMPPALYGLLRRRK